MGEQAVFDVSIEVSGGETTAVLAGELDVLSGETLHAQLDAFSGTSIRLEMREVTFLDSCGLRALLVLRARAQDAGGAVVVCSTSAQVRRLFDLAGVGALFGAPITAD